ncbi:hypothetical protein [Streptomyces mirabilis]|uniref:hypothetical protein n=1 Tax=Streptomyces mirabilis TaxID=68239 RepID=UPI003710F463
MPTSATRAVSSWVIDEHSAHGADIWRAANTDSRVALCRRYGHPVVSVVRAITATG